MILNIVEPTWYETKRVLVQAVKMPNRDATGTDGNYIIEVANIIVWLGAPHNVAFTLSETECYITLEGFQGGSVDVHPDDYIIMEPGGAGVTVLGEDEFLARYTAQIVD